MGCNSACGCINCVGIGVSVPSTGRSGLQLLAKPLASCSGCTFQYPLRVEVGCNACDVCVTGLSNAVSVPSTGRSGLQHRTHTKCVSRLQVSVPSTGRSGLQLHKTGALAGETVVSVPSTGRSGLQLLSTLHSRGRDFGFQYPLRVEVGCNCSTPTLDSMGIKGFSTLYGSKWVATWAK